MSDLVRNAIGLPATSSSKFIWYVHSEKLRTQIKKSSAFVFSVIKTWRKTSMVAFESERLTQSWKSLSKHDFPVDRFCSTEGFPNLGHPSDRIELILVFPHVFWHVSAGIQYFCNPVTGSPGRTTQMRWTFRSRFQAFRDYWFERWTDPIANPIPGIES